MSTKTVRPVAATTPLTEEQRAFVIFCYRDKLMGVQRISTLTGIAARRVSNLIIGAGLQERRRPFGSPGQYIEEALALFDEGSQSVLEIAQRLGIKYGVLRRLFNVRRGAGLPLTTPLDFDEIVRLHEVDKLSVLAISQRLMCGRETIRQILKNMGVHVRTDGEAMKLRWSMYSLKEREHIVKRAHDKIRGRVRPRTERLERAQARRGHFSSSNEKLVFDWLIEFAGVAEVAYPVDIFTCDLAYPEQKLAIEVDGGSWHSSGKKYFYDVGKANVLCAYGWRTFRISVLKGVIQKSSFYRDAICRALKASCGAPLAADKNGMFNGGAEAAK